MNTYVDASALVKGYVRERGSREFVEFARRADTVATSLITRAEVAAAFGKAARMRAIPETLAQRLLLTFREEWPSFTKVQVLDLIVAQADAYAYDQGLRGYDAIHLASALTWQERIGSPVVMATFDQELWAAAKRLGLDVFPDDLSSYTRLTFRRD